MHTRCNLITGFLGSGKTTLIRHLLAQRPPGERWAVIVNEFGVVGIDGTTLVAAGEAVGEAPAPVAIREVAGGCICCAANVPLRVAITDVLRRVRPDRLLIEPSGLGHPAAILATLAEPGLAGAIVAGAVICVVDPRQLPGTRDSDCEAAGEAAGDAGMGTEENAEGDAAGDATRAMRDLAPSNALADTWRDQLTVADVVIANKSDLATATQRARLLAFAEALYPPKQAIVVTRHGEISPAVLDTPRAPWRPVLTGGPAHQQAALPVPEHSDVPALGSRFQASAAGVHSLGWLFDAPSTNGATFEADRLDRLLIGLPSRLSAAGTRLLRAKGAFRTSHGSRLIEWSTGQLQSEPLAFRGPGRFELLTEGANPPDAATIEAGLLKALTRCETPPHA